MPIARTVRQEQHHAESVRSLRIRITPVSIRIQPDHRAHPSWAVKIWPLISKSQMPLDDTAADRFKIRHSGVAAQVLPRPVAAPGLDLRYRLGMNVPIV